VPTCPRCNNSDPRLFAKRKDGTVYCRACVAFFGEEATSKEAKPKPAPLYLPFKLSNDQKKLSRNLISNYEKGIDSLVYAVCGSGKTEISYGVIAYAINKGRKVGFALPRRDVVLELAARLASAFQKNSVISLYGGHTDTLEGDVVVLTTHQLYRYKNYFDLIVMDEIDAFPYKNNDVLHGFFENALTRTGHYILMSATPSEALLASFRKPGKAILELRTRFHRQPIPVPKVSLGVKTFQVLSIAKKLRGYAKEGKPAFVFAPTIDEAEALYGVLRFLVRRGGVIHSKVSDRAGLIEGIREKGLSYLVSTSVLERGVTVKDLQILVYHSDDDSIYDQATLIQIAGRAGRKKDAPNGEVIFYAGGRTDAIDGAIAEIERCNLSLSILPSGNEAPKH